MDVDVDVVPVEDVVVEWDVELVLVVGSCSSAEVDDLVVVDGVDDELVCVDGVAGVGCVLGGGAAVGEAAAEWTGVTPREDRSSGLGEEAAPLNGGAVTGRPADIGACGSDSEAAACSGAGLLAVGRPQAASRTAAMPWPAAITTVRRVG